MLQNLPYFHKIFQKYGKLEAFQPGYFINHKPLNFWIVVQTKNGVFYKWNFSFLSKTLGFWSTKQICIETCKKWFGWADKQNSETTYGWILSRYVVAKCGGISSTKCFMVWFAWICSFTVCPSTSKDLFGVVQRPERQYVQPIRR